VSPDTPPAGFDFVAGTSIWRFAIRPVNGGEAPMATQVLLIALFAVTTTPSPDRVTPNTMKLPAGVSSPAASLADMSWLAGRWTGTGLGGVTEESWSAPAGGAMMGMFRMLKGEQVIFYEFLTLLEHEGSLLLKLKHFNADLTGWEEKADSVRFRLVKITPQSAWFEGLTFHRVDDDTVKVFLAIRNRANGTVREEAFQMKRLN
jgi:hypothetical protein